MKNEKTNKKIKLTFDYETLTPVRTTGVFDENSYGWEQVFRLLYESREHLESNGSVGGGGIHSTTSFEKDVPQLVKQPPHNIGVKVSGIEVYEEDEDGNKTEPKKLQYKDFPTTKDWEIRLEEHQKRTGEEPPFSQTWIEDNKNYISDLFFTTGK